MPTAIGDVTTESPPIRDLRRGSLRQVTSLLLWLRQTPILQIYIESNAGQATVEIHPSKSDTCPSPTL